MPKWYEVRGLGGALVDLEKAAVIERRTPADMPAHGGRGVGETSILEASFPTRDAYDRPQRVVLFAGDYAEVEAEYDRIVRWLRHEITDAAFAAEEGA